MIFDFGFSVADREKLFKILQQPIIVFLAALVLLFYNSISLQLQLPILSITIVYKNHTMPLEYIRDYINDLLYYITLSIYLASVGFII
jgi:hypothetical protein